MNIASMQIITLVVTIPILLRVSYTDFKRLKIDNSMIILAIVTYFALMFFERIGHATGLQAEIDAGISGTATLFNPLSDIATALLLFTIGFALWATRMLGAGDAKFMLPIGLFTGWDYIVPFAFALIVLGTVAFIVLKLPRALFRARNGFCTRILEIRETGRIPYGVILSASLLVALGTKSYALLGH